MQPVPSTRPQSFLSRYAPSMPPAALFCFVTILFACLVGLPFLLLEMSAGDELDINSKISNRVHEQVGASGKPQKMKHWVPGSRYKIPSKLVATIDESALPKVHIADPVVAGPSPPPPTPPTTNSSPPLPVDPQQQIDQRLKYLERLQQAEQQQQQQQQQVAAQQPDKGGEGQAASPYGGLDDGAAFGVSVSWQQNAERVREAMQHAYGSYASSCFGEDELLPISKRCGNWIGAGLTIIDSLSTLHVMGLNVEFQRATDWIGANLKYDNFRGLTSAFETTIRILGGLNSAYDLSRQPVFLTKAKELAERLAPTFRTTSGLPRAQINLASGEVQDLSWTGGATLLAEVGTIQVEYAYLSDASGNQIYRERADRIIDLLDSAKKQLPGLYPIYLHPGTGAFMNSKITLGAMGDSFYEYLLKMWLIVGKNGKRAEQYARMYRESMEGVMKHLYVKSDDSQGLYYLRDLENGTPQPKMDHLVCFVPGMLALGVKHGIVSGDVAKQHLTAAKELIRTCYTSYARMPSGIGPEFMRFQGQMSAGDPSYKLRPETIESLFVMYRVTRDEMYRQWGLEIFNKIEQHCRVQNGYAALVDVRNPAQKEDKMESFFMAETLKYFYLLFSPSDKIPIFPSKLDPKYYVFNTECHPVTAFRDAA